MASPNHRAGLAIVVPVSDNRSQPRARVKQNVFSSPRKPSSQSNTMSAGRHSNGTLAPPRISNGLATSSQQSGAPSSSQPSREAPTQPSNGLRPQASNGIDGHQPSGMAAPKLKGGSNYPLKEVAAMQNRLLGVEEALQYSPFSSIIPFNSDIIPQPSSNFSCPPPLFSSSPEHCTSRQALEYLNEEVLKTQGRSSVVQRVEHDLKPLLSPEAVTEFKFKNIRRADGKHGSFVERKSAVGSSQVPLSRLGPFAESMLQATDLATRYPTPTSPGEALPKSTSKGVFAHSATSAQPEILEKTRQPQQSLPTPEILVRPYRPDPPVTPADHSSVRNDTAFLVNGSLSAKSTHARNHVEVPVIPRVVIPPASAEARHSDFVTYDEDSTSRKRKRNDDAQVDGRSFQTRDQRAAYDEVLRQLEELILDIFEADDQPHLDGSACMSSVKSQYFVSACHEEREISTLSPAMHVKLESLLHKIANVNRLGNIPVEHLRRLQNLCEGAMISADLSNTRINLDWDAEDLTPWIARLAAVENGLRAARTALRIMVGGLEEKALYSEELLQSLLRVVKKALDEVVVPVVEVRSTGSTAAIFNGVVPYKKVISQFHFEVTKVMDLLAKLLLQIEMPEDIVNRIEFFATQLLFVENSQSEKDSVLGIQKFEGLRRTAMDQISVIFSRYPEQRTFLFNEILTSLQKLPVNEKHGRQYRLSVGRSIMLISALIMQLVQISAMRSNEGEKRGSKLSTHHNTSGSELIEDKPQTSDSNADDDLDSNESKGTKAARNVTAMQNLRKDADYLIDNATKSAQCVITFLVHRASNTSKSGESPHRQHLDMFVQDFIAVLGLPEWPAAELLLRIVFAACRNIAENPKSLAPAKTMALELLGMMGSAISDLVSNTRHASRMLEDQDSRYSGYLRQMLDGYLEGSSDSSELIAWDGLYHAVVEYQERNSSDESGNSNAQAFYLAQWAKAVSSEGMNKDAKGESLARNLRTMLSGSRWVVSNALPALSINQCRIAYALTILSMGFCRQSDYILKILLDSITSEQITVRTRSLKSVDKILEGDPSVLDRTRNVKILIVNCANDGSSMVRDSALTLIGKCINLRPDFEQEFLRHILRLADDPTPGVRRRSIKLLKHIYLRNCDKTVKIAIGETILHRAKDLDAGISDLARQTFEDIWLSPFWTVPDLADASAQSKVDLRNQTGLIVGTLRRGDNVAADLIHVLQGVLSNNVKNAAGNFKVCKSLVASAFDIMIDDSPDEGRLEQRHLLLTLTVFATANSRLFTPDQLESLQPYIANLSGKDDLEIFRFIVIVFRCVLPVQSNVQHGLLRDIQKALLQSISKLGKAELNEVADCLWTINGSLHNPEMLLRLILSVLKNLHNMKDKLFTNPDQIDDLKRVKKYIQIAGCFGKHCDFEVHIQTFQSSLTWWRGQCIAGLIVDSITPFTTRAHPLSLRAEAFDSVGLICQSWPYQFTQENISTAFQDVLRAGEPELQNILLVSFRDFFARIDRQAKEKGREASDVVDGKPGERLGGSMTANEGDGASALIAQRFLKDILVIALASQDASALAATQVIASINRQGLVHPKESGPALVALETSINPMIANVAFQEHRLLHQQHESMFEREYMRAIQEAFRYQKEIVRDTLGYTVGPYTSKLHATFEIVKTSKGKYQKKFLSNFCSKINFDVAKIDVSDNPPNVLQFSRFLTENLAFFEYGRLDELLHTIVCMERIVADTGSGTAHSISTEVFNITVELAPSGPGVPQEQNLATVTKPPVDSLRLRQLTTASIILSCLWDSRTYLRRLYGLSGSQHKRESKTKPTAKDLNKAPSRAQGITGDKLVASIAEKVNSLSSEVSMMQQCKDFVELLSVDSEIKVAAEGDENTERPETPSGDDEQDTSMSGGSRAVKRKGSLSTAGTPMKKKKGRPSLKRKQSGKSVGSDEGWD